MLTLAQVAHGLYLRPWCVWAVTGMGRVCPSLSHGAFRRPSTWKAEVSPSRPL